MLQQCLDRTDSGTPLVSASDHPPTFSPVGTFGISHSAVLHHLDQPTSFSSSSFFFELKIPYYLSTMSSGIPQTYSSEAEAVVSLVKAPVRASTYLSLSLFFDPHSVAPEGSGHFFFPRKQRRSSKKGSRRSSSANQCCSCSLPFQNVLEPSQDEGGETQDTVEVPCSENNLKHLVERMAQALPCRPPPL